MVVVPWQQAWQQALYGEGGFYRRPEGPAGHFATSAQGVPGGTELLAAAVLALAEHHRLTHIVEVGAGRGELLTALHAAVPQLRLTGLDVIDPPASLPAAVRWLRSPGGARLPGVLAGLTGTLMLAHEWLDVVPCPVAERDDAGVWRTVEVGAEGAERLGAVVEGEELRWLAEHIDAEAWRAEVGISRDRAHVDLAGRLDDGLVVAVDYGHTAGDRPPGGTLTAYRDGAQVPPVPDGSCDLTAHVAVDTLGADRLVRQRDLLTELLGPEPSRTPPHELARADPTAYLQALARSSAAVALTAPGGLGDFWWALSARGHTRLALRNAGPPDPR